MKISVDIPDSVFHSVLAVMEMNGKNTPSDDEVIAFIKKDIEEVYKVSMAEDDTGFQDAVLEYFSE